jgi:hypothetical protein
MRPFLPFALLPLFLTSIACSQNIQREYDVRHLVMDIPDFTDAPDLSKPTIATMPATPGGGLFGNPLPPESPDARAKAVGTLTHAVRLMLDGAAGATVTETDGRLVVLAPADRHDRVKAAVDAATRDRETQVNVSSHLISLQKELIAKLDPGVRAHIDHAMFNPSSPLLLTEDQAIHLIKATASSTNTALQSGPRVTLFNGQQAYVLTATEKSYIAGHQPVAGKPGEFEPVIGAITSGVLLEVRAYAAGDSLSLLLHPQISMLLDLNEKPWPQAPAGSKLTIQEPVQRVFEANRLATLKSGQWLLLAIPATDPKLADLEWSHFLLVQAKAITQRLEDIPPAFRGK